MWDAKKCVASVQETYNGFIFKIKPHNLTKWNKFHWHCQKKKKKKRSQESLGNSAWSKFYERLGWCYKGHAYQVKHDMRMGGIMKQYIEGRDGDLKRTSQFIMLDRIYQKLYRDLFWSLSWSSSMTLNCYLINLCSLSLSEKSESCLR